MEELFKAITASQQVANTAKDLIGKSYGLALAVVADTQDPMQLARIRVMLPSKGARTLSDWLARVTLFGGLSVPKVKPGDTVVVAFIDGVPTNGVYLGTLNNLINPPAIALDNLQIKVGDAVLTLSPDGKLELTGITSATINGKEIAVMDAKDSRGDHLVSRGY